MYTNITKLAEDQKTNREKGREITGRGVLRDLGDAGRGMLAGRLAGGLVSLGGARLFKRELEQPGELGTGKALKDALESRRFLRKGSLPLDLSEVGRGKKGGGSFSRLLDDKAQDATGYRGRITGQLTAGGTVLAHELGHATGKRLPLQATSVLWNAAGRSALAGSLAPRVALALARDEKGLDNANRLNNAAYATTTLMLAPRLIEEARASLRANPLARKMIGRDINNKALLGAYATYLGGSVVPSTVRYALTRRAIKARRAELADRSK